MGRNMRTLNGRRVRLGDLIEAEFVADGEELTVTVGDRKATVQPSRSTEPPPT